MKDAVLLEKRELRLKIGRMRRRIDARFRATGAEARKLASWRTYVARYPGSAVLAALGLGASGATVFAPRCILKSLGRAILRGSAEQVANVVWRKMMRRRRSAGEEP